jgi:glucosamine kinase
MAVTGETAPEIMGWLTGGRAGDYGRLAPVIVEAAAEGDQFACGVMEGAAREIADVVLALWDGVPDVVHVSGGLGLSLVPWCRQVAPAFDWRVAEADPLRGLALMARGGAPMERLRPRPGLAGPDYAL